MIWFIYGIYVILSFLLVYVLYRKSWQDCLMKGIVVAFLPGVGWLLPIFWPKWLVGDGKEDFEDFITRQAEEHKVKRMGIYQQIERQQELDVIPIEDALLVSENKMRRRVLIDVLKQDAVKYLEILQRAVSNEDKETSYYAVSAIMEAKRKLQLALQDLSVKFEADPTDLLIIKTYADVLHAYMRSGFIDERTLLKYRYTYRDVLQKWIELDALSEWPYQESVDLELLLGSYAEAERMAGMYVDAFPDSEGAYLSKMKVYYEIRSIQRLQEALDSLKNSPIKLSNQALTMVRFWSEGA